MNLCWLELEAVFCPCVGGRTVAQRPAAVRWAGLLLLQGLNGSEWNWAGWAVTTGG